MTLMITIKVAEVRQSINKESPPFQIFRKSWDFAPTSRSPPPMMMMMMTLAHLLKSPRALILVIWLSDRIRWVVVVGMPEGISW